MPSQPHQSAAGGLLRHLRDDLDAKKLSQKQLEDVLGKLKVQGRDVKNVSAVYDEAGVKILGVYAFGDYSSGIRQEASRCLANALLLLPETRRYSIRLGLDKQATDALGSANMDEEFLLARILFLLTYSPQIDLPTLLSKHKLAESITGHLSRHADGFKTTRNTAPDSPALSETLKLLFNVTSGAPGHRSLLSSATGPLFKILNMTPIPSPPLQPPTSLVVNALANLEFEVESLEKGPNVVGGVNKLIDLFGSALRNYSPTELETGAITLITALRNITEKASPELRERMKARLLPDDEERDQPLGKSSSLSSQLLRLTTSTGLTNLSEAVSGLMFELSDKDASQYVHNVGYGYAAGYLMVHKIPIPENAKRIETEHDGESSQHSPINPITGQRLNAEPAPDVPKMTPEEKEREAERLFVLFERLNATGVVNAKNPVRQAMEEGRFEELSDSDADSD
ncbi:hypothetical protein LTR67_006642 [Exophiala xenobiotica]